MSQKVNFLKNTLDLIETDPEVKSYIYQQISEFQQFVTPETLVMVIARDPNSDYETDPENGIELDQQTIASLKEYKFRIAVILQDNDTSIEAEAYDNDIFEAIRLAKENLLGRLIEIQNELENPQERDKAIQQASENKIVH